jgi:fibronectin type 3 domain-containing protein
VTGATGYKVYVSASNDGEYTVVGNPTGNTFTHTELTVDTYYYYKVAAVSIIGEGAPALVTR